MKNILIITTTRDNQGSAVSFVKSIDDIIETDLKEMIKHAILETKNWEKDDLWSVDGVCGSERGYIFNSYNMTPPVYTVLPPDENNPHSRYILDYIDM